MVSQLVHAYQVLASGTLLTKCCVHNIVLACHCYRVPEWSSVLCRRGMYNRGKPKTFLGMLFTHNNYIHIESK